LNFKKNFVRIYMVARANVSAPLTAALLQRQASFSVMDRQHTYQVMA